MVGADTKCLIDHLLGQRMRKEGNLVSAFRLRLAENSKIKEGHLLALLCGELADVRLDKVFFLSMSWAVHSATKPQENTASLVRDG